MSTQYENDFLAIAGLNMAEMPVDELNKFKSLVSQSMSCIHGEVLGNCKPQSLNASVARVVKSRGKIGLACEKHARLIKIVEKTPFMAASNLNEMVRLELSRRAQINIRETEIMAEARNYVAFTLTQRDEVDLSEVEPRHIDAWIRNNAKDFEGLLESIRGPKPTPPPARLPEPSVVHRTRGSEHINRPQLRVEQSVSH